MRRTSTQAAVFFNADDSIDMDDVSFLIINEGAHHAPRLSDEYDPEDENMGDETFCLVIEDPDYL